MARRDGLRLTNTATAVRRAEIIFLALPDTRMGEIYARGNRADICAPGRLLLFAHGFAIHYRTIVPPTDVDVVMVAPKGLGPMVRTQFVEGKGVPCVFAVAQDATGRARPLALAYAKAIGGTRAGVIETSFREETEADLFAEQAVLCGGMSALVAAGFETLVEAGYQPEVAYFECLHELKFIVDLMHRAGISGMRERISETAKWGDVTAGPKIIDASVKARMKKPAQENPERKICEGMAAGNGERAGSATNGCCRKVNRWPSKKLANRCARSCPGCTKSPNEVARIPAILPRENARAAVGSGASSLRRCALRRPPRASDKPPPPLSSRSLPRADARR